MTTETQNLSVNSVKGLFVQHGIKPTSQRIEIGRMLLSRPQHLSADQLLSGVNQDTEIVSKATVYNTLSLFVEKGLIRQVIIDSGRVFYDSNTTPHFHLYNEDSGELMDYKGGQMEFGDLPELPENTTLSGIDVIIRVKGSQN
jgi:Fur family iron response transcriptional regulator